MQQFISSYYLLTVVVFSVEYDDVIHDVGLFQVDNKPWRDLPSGRWTQHAVSRVAMHLAVRDEMGAMYTLVIQVCRDVCCVLVFGNVW